MRNKNYQKLLATLFGLCLVLTACTPFSLDLSNQGSQNTAKPNPDAVSIQGKTSKAFGTDSMAPIGTLADMSESAAFDLGEDPAKSPKWEKFYHQKISWGECEREDYYNLECAKIMVPLKWNEPEGETIELLLTRSDSRISNPKGSIIVNPGGPGASGAEFIASFENIASTDLGENFEFVGFDPRGVKDSAGIQCLNDEQTDKFLAGDPTDSGADWLDVLANACKANSGKILPYIDTYSTARDLDVIRAVVGDEKLNYLGYSYGTYLGATYADLYPERIQAMVLDAPVDPSLTSDELSAGQAAGLEQATRAYVKWCLEESGSCPLKGTVDDGVSQIQELLKATETNPLPTSQGRELTSSLATTGVLAPLYSDELWEFLNSALAEAFEGSGDSLLFLSDIANERNYDGTYKSNGNFAIIGINCLDHISVVDEQWIETETKRLTEMYPTFGPIVAGPGVLCEKWPAAPVRVPKEITASGSPTILVIGTTGDMATPYPWAVSIDQQLENSVLLTFKGEGHTAYGRSGGCIEEMVDAYFISGALPDNGTVCE